MTGILSDRSLARLRGIGSVLFMGLFAYYVVDTLHWPMKWDTPVMHYVRFLMTHGLHPYSDITDMNLPGCYMTEGWGMAIFGWSDVSWRIYEAFLLAGLTVSGMVIGGKRNWFAGIYAATFFVVMHGSEGPRVATERDELMAILLVAATAAMLVAVRRRTPVVMVAFGLLTGLAMSLKPGALVMEVALLGLLLVFLRGTEDRFWSYVGWALTGNVVIGALMVGFFVRNHDFGAMVFILRRIVPSYSKLAQPTMAYMFRHLMPAALVPLIVLAGVAFWRRGGKLGMERWAFLLGMLSGAVSYFMQRKGLTYHRYMFVLFLLLWIGWELSEAMHREKRFSRGIAVAGVALLFLVVAPYYVRIMISDAREGKTTSPLPFKLQDDLTQLGGDKLQRQVLCLDLVNGCFDALYRMRLVQNTGATGDLLLFAPTSDYAVDYYRKWFMDRDREHPANVVVVLNEWYQAPQPNFAKIEAWPEYAAYLHTMYVPVIERRFGDEVASPAYRIYLRKGSAVMAAEEANPLR